MKRILFLLAVCCLMLVVVACTPDEKRDYMTWDEYMAAEIDSEVTIEAYVQGKQAWWENKGTFYLQDEDGGYFVYEMPCTEEEYNKLTVGTKIRVTGVKAEWAGEIEIVDPTFKVLEGNYVAKAVDVTDKLGTDELIKYQNMKVSFSELTVVNVAYKNNEIGNDIYVTVSYNGAEYDFCVESYLTDKNTDVYKAVSALNIGDHINVEGFLYWYNGVNTHITSVSSHTH